MPTSLLKKSFDRVTDNLEAFLLQVDGKKSALMATREWSVKDVFCHLVFWHESYASNYAALAEKREPKLLVGPGYRLNSEGVRKLRGISLAKLKQRLRRAHASLRTSILKRKVPKMTYKTGGRVYETPDFLDMVARHLKVHSEQVRKAK